MRAVKPSSGFFAYLEKMGKVGASGDELVELKKSYRRLYEKEYKRNHRVKHKQYCLSFTRLEAKRIVVASREYEMKEADLIKKCVWGYLDTVYIVHHKETIDRVLQMLLRYQTAIERLEDGNKGSWFKPDRSYRELERTITDIQKEVREAFMNPPKLAELLKQALADDINFKQTVLTILAEYGT